MMNRTMVVAVLALVGCGTKRVNLCTSDADCKDPAYPFCDVNGEYPASGGEKNSCTVVPDNCPVDRCGCTPNAVLSCTSDQVTICGADGTSTVTDTCALGCAADGTRCLTFDPSNGLGGALAMAAGEPDVVLPAGTHIDTDLGNVVDGNGVPIALTSIAVPQTGGPNIRAFIAHSFVVNGLVVRGTAAFALLAPETITIQGTVDAAAHGATSGPGAEGSPFACASATVQEFVCTGPPTLTTIPSSGGGGNATAGGDGHGAGTSSSGGTMVSGFVPLYGGCRGGGVQNTTGGSVGLGGGGGGAIEVVSLRAITFTGSGFVNLGGGGGSSSSGGGSGGVAVLEAPSVQFSGDPTGLTANGGAGGGCGVNGSDGTTTLTPAVAPTCTTNGYSAGDGGTETIAPGSSKYCVPGGGILCPLCDAGPYGGGGGSVGRLRIATKDGTYALLGTPVVSAAVAEATLVPR